MVPLDIPGRPRRREVVDDKHRVLGSERDAFERVARGGPRSRQMTRVHIGAEVLLSQCAKLALARPRPASEVNAEISGSDDTPKYSGQDRDRDPVWSQLKDSQAGLDGLRELGGAGRRGKREAYQRVRRPNFNPGNWSVPAEGAPDMEVGPLVTKAAPTDVPCR